jgi:cytochrome b pre-mRNA-processing protein 3
LTSIFKRIFGGRSDTARYAPLYAAIVAEARRPHWYAVSRVPDTIDGRFDMVSTILALVLLRLEEAGVPGREPAARVAELFVTDMDGQLRQEGIGDLMVGKHIGRIMSALGGRTTAYREGLAQGGDLPGAIDRNIYRLAEDVPAEARAHLDASLRAVAAMLAACDLSAVLAGRFEAVPA